MAFIAKSALVFWASILAVAEVKAQGHESLVSQHREPVAIAMHGKWLYVANRRSGSVSVIDRSLNDVVAEYRVGIPNRAEISDLCYLPASRELLLPDRTNHCVHVLSVDGARLRPKQMVPVAHTPVRAVASTDGSTVVVPSLWAQQVNLIKRTNNRLSLEQTIDLPFAPLECVILAESNRAIIAGAFRAEFAILNLESARIEGYRSFNAHNVRGLAWDRANDRIIVAHQSANPIVPTQRERVFWGAVVSNQLRTIPTSEFLTATQRPTTSIREDKLNQPRDYESEPIGHWSLLPIGEPGFGAGDPAAVLSSADGHLFVLTSGTGELHMRGKDQFDFDRISLGRHPIEMVYEPSGQKIYVINAFSDSVSVVDVNRRSVVRNIHLGPRPEFTFEERGRHLFFDSRLSLDGWYSCHSCHTNGHTNGRIIDNLSDGTIGTPKQIPSLLGVMDTPPWAWDGSKISIDEQIQASIEVTMRGDKLHASYENVESISAYLRTLRTPPSVHSARSLRNPQLIDQSAVERGRELFRSLGCRDCHRPWTYTSDTVIDVGLSDEAQLDNYNPPSLRGLSQRSAYYHDGRAKNLKDVLTIYRHAGLEPLSEQELEDLLAFLYSL